MASQVATVLTVYGIETFLQRPYPRLIPYQLQPCLPFTVLKLAERNKISEYFSRCNRAYRLRY